jgi:homoserine O-acetyltransferase
MANPNLNGGDYYGKELPGRRLAVARMVGHITYISDDSMAKKSAGDCARKRPSASISKWISK